ncbi:hypothetical protein RHSIM_Rhsim10G0198900 [Rhododendron simsii]|uniref:serine O-acetyltransferase n=1 Tax=Rhododendron simsii TaxID=118357 RepID=A0A834GA95_RHOSS|nr:hypothetical protein RHSIM_Rhsim10G0198900 [Rhododendron simsii]
MGTWVSFSDTLSKRLVIEEDENTPPNPKLMEFRFDKVFPVYAMGVLKPDPDPLLAVLSSGSDLDDPIWDAVRKEAKLEAEKEPILSSFLYASILSHDCLEQALGFVLANRLQSPTLLATQLMDIFCKIIMDDRGIQRSIRLDVQAFKDRDPSCLSFCSALLYLKGYHSLQTYRVAHTLWNQGRRVLALALQSRISEVFGVDIHPELQDVGTLVSKDTDLLTSEASHDVSKTQTASTKINSREDRNAMLAELDRLKVHVEGQNHLWKNAAKIGEGILLDHATGVVIGETAVVGNRVSLMQGVTLGGTGKEIGDRHPKIGQGALIGACANILGNIKIGEGAMIAAGSLVLKDVPPRSMVAGIPAKVIGYYADEQDPSLTMKHDASKEFFEHLTVHRVEGRSSGRNFLILEILKATGVVHGARMNRRGISEVEDVRRGHIFHLLKWRKIYTLSLSSTLDTNIHM